ncbi:hypothetical protein TELCIR_24683, partial [Teladorsagia circumcincta]
RPAGERFDPRYIKATVKHNGGTLMVYGAFSLNGMGSLLRIQGKMTGQIYMDMIFDSVLPWAKRNMPAGWILQQDNGPKHTSKVVTAAFQQRHVKLFEWPSQSPDFNLIGKSWSDGVPSNHAQTRTRSLLNLSRNGMPYRRKPSGTSLKITGSLCSSN